MTVNLYFDISFQQLERKERLDSCPWAFVHAAPLTEAPPQVQSTSADYFHTLECPLSL